MEDTNIMNNEAIETVEEVIKNTGMKRSVKIAAGVGLGIIVGYVVYKYVAKPIVANIKANINQKKLAAKEQQMHEDYEVVTTIEETE